MHCQRMLFPIFLFIYILTGIILAIAFFLLRSIDHGYHKYGSHLNRLGRYYIGVVSLYILFTCIIHLITIYCFKRTVILFRIVVILLILGIVVELTAVAIIVFIRDGNQPGTRRTTLIAVSLLTCYLVILQIYGVISSLSFHAEIRDKYKEVPLK